jgi:hypothetical protein
MRFFPFRFAGVAARLAACVLTGCDGGPGVTDAATASPRVETPPATGSAVQAPGDRRRAMDVAGRTEESDRRTTEERQKLTIGSDDQCTEVTCAGQAGEEAHDARAITASNEAPPAPAGAGYDAVLGIYTFQPAGVADLEFSPGLPAPPQQNIVPAAHVWTPSPSAAASAPPVIEGVWPDRGPSSGGDRVVIRGRNLQAAQVVFGLSLAPILSETDETVVVASPGGEEGLAAIVVTNRDGNYAIVAEAFRYLN